MIEIKMNKGDLKIDANSGLVEFLTETIAIVWKLTEAYAEQRSISVDEAFEEIREKVELAKEWEEQK
jgi:translation elongation factor EF-G